jgi:porin
VKKLNILLAISALFIAARCQADNEEVHRGLFSNIWEKEAPADGLFGLNDQLCDAGIELALGVTQIYQQNVHGGISTRRRAGRYSGSYDIELSADLKQLLGIKGGNLFIHCQGGWPDIEGIDETSVGSAFGVNADAIGNRGPDIVEFFYEDSVFNNNINLKIGKMDFTYLFDSSAFADDETSQFLNGAFVDNPTIPFPDYSLGIVLSFNLTEPWYISAGIARAEADGSEINFRNAFHSEDYFFYILEAGMRSELNSTNGSMLGTYRIGLWNDPQPKANSDDADASKSHCDDIGFYLSFDQTLAKENNYPEDSQGFGAFFRYGYANNKRNDVTNFWSIGLQYKGPLDKRDDDVLGVGFAHGSFSELARSTYPMGHESVLELYYNAQISPLFNISPGIQYIANPGGARRASDAVVLELRVQMEF